MRKWLLILLPLIILGISITYASFNSKLYIGSNKAPDVVQTGYLKWNVYLASEAGLPWNQLPNCIDGVFVPYPPYIIVPEKPDVGHASIQRSGTTVKITLTNVYPGYGAVGHFIYKYDGSVPSKLRNVNITVYDPNNIKYDMITGILMIWDPDGFGGSAHPQGALLIGWPITDLPLQIKAALNNVTFVKGGYIAFCKPNGTNVTITKVIINPNSGLTQDEINALNHTDSFWIIVPPSANPPQGAYMSFNMTLTFGQYNEP